jgi:hypothetical protein
MSVPWRRRKERVSTYSLAVPLQSPTPSAPLAAPQSQHRLPEQPRFGTAEFESKVDQSRRPVTSEREGQKAETHLVHAPRIPVKQHLHRVLHDLPRILLLEQLLPVRSEVVERFAKERLGKVHAETGRDGGRGVGHADEVDVGKEAAES